MDRNGRIGDYVTLQRGTTYKGTLVGKPGPALLGLGSIHPGGGFREGDYKTYGGECPPKLMLYPGDLFVSLKGATKDGKMIGSVARVPLSVASGRLTQDTVKLEIRDSRPEVAKFLYWILRTPQYREYCDGRAMGSAVVALSRDDFLGYPVPPITKARLDVVDSLELLDEKIELNRRMNATLETTARALFQSWFVDFDPVRTKVDGRELVGLDSTTDALFPDSFHETSVGHIPTGWSLGRLSDLCNLKRGHDLPSSIRTPGTVPVISSSGISGTHAETNVRGPGVVTGRYGTIGKVFYVEKDYWPLNTTLYVDDFKGNPPRFIFHALGKVNFTNYIDKAAVPGINRNHLHGEPTVLPPMELRKAFARTVTPLWAQHAVNERQSRTISAIRDALLPKLMQGELMPEITPSEYFYL